MSNSTRQRTEEVEAETVEEEEGEEVDARQCPECGSDELMSDSERAEVVCGDCGLVIEEDKIDPGPEWRAFDHSENQEKSRVGAPTTKTMHDKGLTTTIDWKNKDAYGRSISSEKRSQMHRLRKWQERIRTKDASERNLQFALSEIDRMASALGVPRSVREVASVIYRQTLKEDLIRGRSIEGVATAALYAACRKEGIPRSLEEISEVSRVDRKEIGRTVQVHLAGTRLGDGAGRPQEVRPEVLLRTRTPRGGTDEGERDNRYDLREGSVERQVPDGFAAAAIYAASLLCNQKRTQREVAEVANVTEVTIRNRYQEQMEVMGLQ